ncbi:MAG: DUF2796 domain-containing protein [Halochromatium sp.]|nr:DUF2796 domain-containing protein [Halochromatium sp.]
MYLDRNRLFTPFSMLALATLLMMGSPLAAENQEEHDHAVAHDHDHDHDHNHGQHDQTHRQHDAHVHGIARLNLALDAGDLYLELISPAANLVGFEHLPTTAADQAKLAETVVMLEDGARLFRLSPSARCELRDSDIASGLLENGLSAEPSAGQDEHSAVAAHDHHGHRHDEDSAAVVGTPAVSHADIDVRYRFQCAKPAALESVDVRFFEVFPGTERLDVQFVLDHRQGGATLNHDNQVLRF